MLQELSTKIGKIRRLAITEIEEIVKNSKISTLIEAEAVQAFAVGRYFKELGQAIENEASDNALKYLRDNEMNLDFGGINVSYREYKTKVYPKDEQLSKYEKMVEEKEQELKELKQSVKNRKATLEAEGKTVEMINKASLSGRMK